MLDRTTEHCRQMTIGAAVASLMLMLVLPYGVGIRVDVLSFKPIFLLVAVLAMFIPYVAWRKLGRMKCGLEASALGLVMALPVLVFSYSAMRAALPLSDHILIAMDRFIGFDWPWYVSMIDSSPLLSTVLAYAYSSFSFQLLLLPIALSLLGYEKRAFQMVLAYLLMCSSAIALSVPFPAVGAYKAFGITNGDLSSINAHFGYFFLKSFNAVRDNPSFTLGISSAAGIITFPSIHAGVAVVCGWASWRSLWLRVPMTILNFLMALSAISHGSHYLVDVLAGAAVALATIWVVVRLSRPSARVFLSARSSICVPERPGELPARA
jgi:membrane-associated phospholipid phosphatase